MKYREKRRLFAGTHIIYVMQKGPRSGLSLGLAPTRCNVASGLSLGLAPTRCNVASPLTAITANIPTAAWPSPPLSFYNTRELF